LGTAGLNVTSVNLKRCFNYLAFLSFAQCCGLKIHCLLAQPDEMWSVDQDLELFTPPAFADRFLQIIHFSWFRLKIEKSFSLDYIGKVNRRKFFRIIGINTVYAKYGNTRMTD